MVDLDLQSPTIKAIYESYEKLEEQEPRRKHLGASVIGKECSRQIWYSFRWAVMQKFEGRMLRLFRRGHREEEEILDDLKRIGCQVYTEDDDGNRYRKYDHGGHYSGEFDAVIMGLPESPNTPHLGEFKTANKKSYNAVTKHSIEAKKPEHVAQMQVLMDMFDLERAAYFIVCKDDDRMHMERFKRKKKEGKRLRDRALRIIDSPTPPEKISDDAASFGCRFCDAKELCHGTQVADVNCRTCVHSTPITSGDGGWSCAVGGDSQNIHPDCESCPDHIFIPGLIPFAGPVDGDDAGTHIIYEDAEGNEFANVAASGFPAMDIPHHTSKELRAMEPQAAFSSEVAAVKKILGGEVVG